MHTIAVVRYVSWLAVLGFSLVASAQITINVPADQPTIQQAIDAAANGDTVLVAPGTYHENISFNGKAITVKSSSGAPATVISGLGNDSAVTFAANEGPNSILDGFTVRGGSALDGGGIFISSSSPTVRSNVITQNFATHGGGIAVTGSGSPLVTGNLISNNSASDDGGGIAVFNISSTTGVIANNVIADNSANRGPGIYLSASERTPHLQNNTIINSVFLNASVATLMENNIIFVAGNTPPLVCGPLGTPTLIDNILFAADGTSNGELCPDLIGRSGNISADPLFVNPGRGDYHLAADSPAWNSGDSTAQGLPATDFDGNPRIQGPAVDRGAFEEANPPVLAQLTISPASFAFADQAVETTSPAQEFVLTNSGTVATQSMEVSTPDEFPQTNNCSSSLAVGDSCSVFVSFAPATARERQGVMKIFGNFGSQYPEAMLSGTGVARGKLSQTITFAALPDQTYGNPPFVTNATASSGLAVSFAAAGSCTVSGNVVTITTAGSCSITASQPGNDAFEPAPPVTQSFTIHKANQSILFSLPSSFPYGTSLTLEATASSGLPVSFSATGNCTVSGNTLSATAPGSCSVTASQAGDDRYEPASTTQSLVIAKGQQVIHWSAPAAIILGTPLTSTQLNATVTVTGAAPAGALSYTPAAGTILGPGAGQLLTVTAAETDFYASATASVQINVEYQSTGLCLGEPGHMILGKVNADGSSVFQSGSTVPVNFRVCDANGNSIGTAGAVRDFRLIQVVQGTVLNEVNEPVDANNPFTQFRWDPSDQQWVFQISTDGLAPNRTYYYQIALADGSSIFFRFGVQD
jgi:parallel beta-helix repeat protein